jgi:AcrR family transcriptional regulator
MALDRTRVAEAALALLDAEGRDAVSMRRVARALGVTPMALYNHVRGKQGLADAIAELVAAEAAPPADGPWDERVRETALRLRAACRAHPAAVPLLQTTRSMAPPLLAPMEAVLDALAGAGFDRAEALAGWAAVVGLVLGHVTYELGGHGDPGAPLPAPVDAETFPRIAAAMALPGRDPDAAFAFALDALVAGLRSRQGARRS